MAGMLRKAVNFILSIFLIMAIGVFVSSIVVVLTLFYLYAREYVSYMGYADDVKIRLQNEHKDALDTAVKSLPYCLGAMTISLMFIVIWLLNKIFDSNKRVRNELRVLFAKLPTTEKYPPYLDANAEEYSFTTQQEMLPPKGLPHHQGTHASYGQHSTAPADYVPKMRHPALEEVEYRPQQQQQQQVTTPQSPTQRPAQPPPQQPPPPFNRSQSKRSYQTPRYQQFSPADSTEQQPSGTAFGHHQRNNSYSRFMSSAANNSDERVGGQQLELEVGVLSGPPAPGSRDGRHFQS